MDVIVRAATTEDLGSVERLLVDAGLLTAGVADHLDHFLVAEAGGRIIASAGLERYGAHALLRSVAVAPGYRNRGLARGLVSRLLEGASREQVREVLLFTNTAQTYFSRFGFSSVTREEVAEPVRASKEYGECCADAQAMRLRLSPQRTETP